MSLITKLPKIVVAAGITFLFGFLALAIVTFIDNAKSSSPRMTCQSNLKQIGLAVMQYNADYTEYPPANNSNHGLKDPKNWIGRISPYAGRLEIFQCPSDGNATDAQKSSYGYNARLGSITPNFQNPAIVILNFEVQADADNWTQSGIAPTIISANKRHLDGANYSFVDGHVKWLKPESIKDDKPNGKNYTFLVK